MARRLVLESAQAEFAREGAAQVDLPQGWGRAELAEASLSSSPWFMTLVERTLDAIVIEPSDIPLSDVAEIVASSATADAYGLGIEAACDLASLLYSHASQLECELDAVRDAADVPVPLDEELATVQKTLRDDVRRALVRMVTVPLELKSALQRHATGRAAESQTPEGAEIPRRLPADLMGIVPVAPATSRVRRAGAAGRAGTMPGAGGGLWSGGLPGAGSSASAGASSSTSAGAGSSATAGASSSAASGSAGARGASGSAGSGGVGGAGSSAGKDRNGQAGPASGGFFFTPGGGERESADEGGQSQPNLAEKIRTVRDFATSEEARQIMAFANVGARHAWEIYQQRRTNGGGKA